MRTDCRARSGAVHALKLLACRVISTLTTTIRTLTTIISTLTTIISTLTTIISTLKNGGSTYLRLESATAEGLARAAHAAACPPADSRAGSCASRKAKPHAPVCPAGGPYATWRARVRNVGRYWREVAPLVHLHLRGEILLCDLHARRVPALRAEPLKRDRSLAAHTRSGAWAGAASRVCAGMGTPCTSRTGREDWTHLSLSPPARPRPGYSAGYPPATTVRPNRSHQRGV